MKNAKTPRARAEKLLATTRRDVAQMPVENVQKLMHELQVHQVELEMQNDELHRTQLELEAARDQFAELYDFAPVAYLTLDAEGRIHEANLMAAKLLEVSRDELPRKELSRFIASESQDAFHLHRHLVLAHGGEQNCELAMHRRDGSPFFARLESRVVPADGRRPQRWRTTLTDITASRQKQADQLRDASSLPEESPSPIMRICGEGKLLYANAASAPFLAEWQCRLDDPVPAAWQSLIRAAMKRGTIQEREMVLGERTFKCLLAPFKARGYVNLYATDTTGRKRAEAAVKASERKYRRLHDTITDAFVSVDMSGRILEFNAAYRKMLGYTEAALLRLTYEDVTPKKWHAFENAIVREQVLPHGFSVVYEKEYRRKDGTVFPVELRTILIKDNAGNPAGMWAIIRDITERKQSEVTLRAAEEFKSALLDSLPAEIAVLNPKGVISAVNEPWLRFARENGNPPIRRVGVGANYLAACREAIREGDPFAAKAVTGIRAVLDGQRTKFRMDYACDSPEAKRWFHLHALAAPSTVGGAVIAHSDITALKNAEESLRELNATLEQRVAERTAALRENQASLQSFFDSAPFHMGIAELAGNKTMVVSANRAVADFLQQPQTDLAGRKSLELGTPKTVERLWVANCRRSQREGVPVQFEYEYPQAGKDNRWLRATVAFVSSVSARHPRFSFVVEDITERKRGEYLLLQANRTLQAIRDCHEAMLRATTENDLLAAICQIIVKTGGERMAWVGFAEQNARKTVRPVASAGVSSNYLANARITWADAPRGRGPVGTAIRTGKVSLCQNTFTNPNFAPWRAGARRIGFGAVIALPLLVEGQCIGALCIYAAEPDAFDATEQLLLKELANDLAFGISSLRLRAERQRLEDELLETVERERESVGRDLHDGICQVLVAAKFRSAYLKQIVKGRFPEAEREAQALEKSLSQAIEQGRDLARGLNPVHVMPADLPAALQKLADNVTIAKGPQCSCQFAEPVKLADPHAAYHLYRIAQEAVQNVLTHARAKNISLTLAHQDLNLVLSIKDDGKGIPRRLKKTGMGLNNMQVRARLIGARLEVRRRAAGGTAVICELPQPTGKTV